MDEEIVREEYEKLIRKIEEGKSDAVHRVMKEDEYEDEFSHNAIDKMHGVLFDMTKEYLHQKHPGEYIVGIDWGVFVLSAEEARRRGLTKNGVRTVY